MKTIEYYNSNAQSFYDRTINADISDSYKKFLEYMREKAHILDAGCGIGRDTKYFLSQGYQVTAFDASEKMVELASKETGANVVHSTFQDLNFDQIFDGIWAQASLLHIPYDETRDVYRKIHQSLKPHGVFYASYKYGADFMPTEERDFYNMNEETIKPYLSEFFDIIEIWTKKDNRSKVAPSPEGSWLNFIVRKNGTETPKEYEKCSTY
jgi:SAM-dependent methyltransferase